MNSSPDPQNSPRQREITVPRDADTDDVSGTQDEVTPSPDTSNITDEDYARRDKPLPADSPLTEALHDNPPTAHDQLQVGSGGDAARPGKTGTSNTSIPPRGNVRKQTR